MSALTPGQSKFAAVFARETGLNPQVVGAWLLAEQSGSAAKNYEGKGYHNWLNIAQTDSGPASGAHSSVWKNPESAAKASADWIRGQGQIAHEYGQPASGIKNILHSAGLAPHRQIQAIANSGWASSGYEHGTGLSSLLGQVKDVSTAPGKPGEPMPGATRQSAMQSIFGTQRTFNQQGFEEASQHARGERAAASLFGGGSPGDALLREVLSRAGTPPNPEQFGGSRVVKTGERSVLMPANSGKNAALTNTVPHGTQLRGFLPNGVPLKIERKDQGQDIRTKAGTPILAPGRGTVKLVQSDPNGFGIAYPIVHFDTGPLAGHDVYIGHTKAALRPGQRFNEGDVLSHTQNGSGPYVGNAKGLPGWAEIGLWNGGPGNMQAGNQIAPLLGLR